jgi:hypothetical protein
VKLKVGISADSVSPLFFRRVAGIPRKDAALSRAATALISRLPSSILYGLLFSPEENGPLYINPG